MEYLKFLRNELTGMRFKAELFDYLQYLYDTTGFNDHQLHCVIIFENKINALAMEMAVRLLIKTVPILSRVYRNNNGSSYWEDINPLEWTDLFMIVDNEEDFERFTFSKTNEEIGPQIKVCLLQSASDSLSIIMNHMVCDGAGIKQCAYLLADIYSNILKNPEYVPGYIIDGDRSFKKIISGVRLTDRIKILLFNNKDNNQRNNYKFPMSTEAKTSPFILRHEILPERYYEIRNFCKKHNVTVNDVILTAYFRVLSDMLNLNGKALSIPIMIDMRRYLTDKSFNAPANLSSTVIIRLGIRPGEDFCQTLAKVSSEMNVKKNNYLGLNTFLKLDAVFKIFKDNWGYKILKNSLKNPDICMTNIGVLDSTKLIFEGSPITNAFICGSIKYRPHFQLAISSFNDKMTFCVNLYGSRQDRENISKFLELMDSELKIVSKDGIC